MIFIFNKIIEVVLFVVKCKRKITAIKFWENIKEYVFQPNFFCRYKF